MVPPLVELALNYYRSPLDYSHLADVEQPLPRGFPSLVTDFGAALSNARIEETAQQLSTTPDEIQAAARFFARHALLNPASDHYRCLGLNRKSTSDDIRSNYKTLIRLFHPDRMSEVDEVDLAYSSRLNAAYRLLRDPEARSRYDHGLRKRQIAARRGDTVRFFQANPNAMAAAEKTRRSGRAWTGPKHAASIAFLILVGLFGISISWLGREKETATLRLTRPPLEVTQQQVSPLYFKGNDASADSGADNNAQQTHQQTAPLTAVKSPTWAELDIQTETKEVPIVHGAQRADLIGPADVLSRHLRDSHSATPIKPDQRATAVINESSASEDVVTGTALATDGLQPSPSVDERIEAIREAAIAATKQPTPQDSPETQSTVKSSSPSTKPSAQHQPQGQTSPARPTTQPTTEFKKNKSPKPEITIKHAEVIAAQVVGELESAYRSGNAAAFAALFASDARTTDGNGRERIREIYGDLFRKSTEQSLTIRRIRWNLRPDRKLSGSGQIAVSVKDRAKGWRRLNGEIRLELNQVGNGYLIAAMDYNVVLSPTESKTTASSDSRRSGPTQAVQPAPAPAPAPKIKVESAPLIGAKMVGRLESAYGSGNASAFAALFTSDARTTDGNGRARIRQLYGDLFRKSAGQSMSIRNVRWSRSSNGRISGQGQVSVSVNDQTSGSSRVSGSIRFELIPLGDDYRVAAMYYDVN